MGLNKMMPAQGRRRSCLAALVFVSVAGRTSPAAAQVVSEGGEKAGPGAKAPAGEAAPSGRASWYGYQTFAPDALALTVFLVAGDQGDSGPVVGTVAGLYLLGGPLVHGLHRRPGAVVGSVAMRVLLPFASMAVGSAVADCSVRVVNDENCDFGEKIVGFAVGMGLAMIADAALLSWERPTAHPAAAPAAHASASPSVALSPVPLRGGGGLVLMGLF